MANSQVIEIDNFISKDTCESIICSCEAKSQNDVITVTHADRKTDGQGMIALSLLNQHRIRFTDVSIQSIIQIAINALGHCSMTIHDSFSYVRYENDGYVPEHLDKYNDKSATHSIIVYLNDDYDEGRTYIRQNNETKRIDPKIGKLLVFKGHELVHGCDKVNGIKKILVGKLTINN